MESEEQPLRVGLLDLSYPPWQMQCGRNVALGKASGRCAYPGLEFELKEAIAHQLNYSIQWTPVNWTTENMYYGFTRDLGRLFDVPAVSLTYSLLDWMKLNGTPPLFSEPVYAVTSNHGGHVFWQLAFNHFTVFSISVWLLLILILASRPLLAALTEQIHPLATLSSSGGSVQRTQRFVLPITIGMMVMSNLYANSLLSKLLLDSKDYLVNDEYDLAALPPSVTVMTMFTPEDHTLPFALVFALWIRCNANWLNAVLLTEKSTQLQVASMQSFALQAVQNADTNTNGKQWSVGVSENHRQSY